MNFLLLTSFGEVMGYIGYILLALLILLIMITVHEAGHYFAGKLLGFKIDEFAIGFGPKLFSRKKKDGEIFSVRLFPLGGFCAFHGEDEDSMDSGAFNNKSPWKRIIVLISGALMNYILALLVIIIMFGAYGQTALMVGDVSHPEGYSITNSLSDGDVILSIDGKTAYLITDIMEAVEGKKAGDSVFATVLREKRKQKISVTLRSDTDFKNVEDVVKLYNALGINYALDGETVTSVSLYSTSVRLGFFEVIGKSFEYSFILAGTIFKVLFQLITGKLGMGAVGGTVSTITLTANVIATGGFKYLLYITSFIGVNLAVFNLLPFPALDGARAVFCGIEGIRGKPINRRVEGIIHTVGLVLILLFAVFADLQRCF